MSVGNHDREAVTDGHQRCLVRWPAHLRPSLIGLVMLGGVVGTALRNTVSHLIPAVPGAWPWATFGINLTGALLLGLLLEWLVRLRPEDPRRRILQLSLGTGVLGGFTTYSSFAVETVALATHGAALVAVAYASSSIALGFVAAFGGSWLGRRLVAVGSETQVRP